MHRFASGPPDVRILADPERGGTQARANTSNGFCEQPLRRMPAGVEKIASSVSMNSEIIFIATRYFFVLA